MFYADILPVVSFKGTSFVTLDAVTTPTAGVTKTATGVQLLVFAMPPDRSGYEAMVKRRLKAEGKNPDNFTALDLPWGEKIEGTPLILHRGKVYLQGVILNHGAVAYTLPNGVRVDPVKMRIRMRRSNQGLSKGNEVEVVCYDIMNITRITANKQTVTA